MTDHTIATDADGTRDGTASGTDAASSPFAALPNLIDLGSGDVCGPEGC